MAISDAGTHRSGYRLSPLQTGLNADGFDSASIGEADREKTGRLNARALFKLDEKPASSAKLQITRM